MGRLQEYCLKPKIYEKPSSGQKFRTKKTHRLLWHVKTVPVCWSKRSDHLHHACRWHMSVALADGIHSWLGPTCQQQDLHFPSKNTGIPLWQTYSAISHTSGIFLHLFSKKSSHWTCLPTTGPTGKRRVKIKMSRLSCLWIAACNPDSGFIYDSSFPKVKAANQSWKLTCTTPLAKLMLIWPRTWRTQRF